MTAQVVPLASPAPRLSTTWPVNNDVPDLLAIVQSQAVTVADNAAMIDRYQGILDNAQAVPPATGTGTAAAAPNGTQLTVSGVNGKIALGAVVTGSGVSQGVTITGQVSGIAGGNGVYTTSMATTASGSALTFTPGGGTTPWPVPRDPLTLTGITQAQTAIIRNQTSLIQQYQDLLNTSEVPAA